MDFLELAQNRRSYRGPYLPDPVPREALRRMLEAGLAAPSGCNKQTTSLLALDDPAVLAKVTPLLEHPGFSSAPAAICVLTRRIIAYRDRCYQVQDYAAAIENILLEIAAQGYASCWVEGHITDVDRIGRRMADLLGVPQEYELVAYLPVGLPAQQASRAAKKPFEERAWFNGFGLPESRASPSVP